MRKLHVLLLMCVMVAPAGATVRSTAVQLPIVGNTSDVTAGVVTLEGEIVVMQGDDEIVTTNGPGAYNISPENLANIVDRFYLHYPDEFDGIAVILTFPDGALGGAYATCGEQGAQGLGPALGGCSAQSTRLLSVVNMNGIDQYGTMDFNDQNWFVFMGQEFGHSWLTFWHFIDPLSGMESEELLGRQVAHYATNVAASGSVMDGVDYLDNGDGTFTVTGIMTKYSKLDLYAMGIIPAEQVDEDIYIIRNAMVLPGGEPLDPAAGLGQLGVGTRVAGDKLQLTMNDLLAANGPRMPNWDDAPEEFRQAFVLVTMPGETAAMVQPQIDKLDVGRIAWEERFAAETQNRGFVCTNVTAPCPRASAKVISATVIESVDDSDGDGVIEPGETATAQVTFWNTGGADATTAIGEIRSDAVGVVLPAPMTLPTIPVNEMRTFDFPLEITGDACGVTLDLEARATIETRHWKTPFGMRPGIVEGVIEPFATEAGWTPDYLFVDTATNGKWGHGVPAETFYFGRKLQPAGGHGGAMDAAWFTDISDAWNTGELAGGETTLTTSIYDLSTMYRPSLRFWLWYVALDHDQTTITPDLAPHLRLEISTDGGLAWTLLEEIGGGPFKWELHETPIPESVVLTNQVRFRFTAYDDLGTERLVEVGLDDVQLISLSDACKPGGGGGCGCVVAARTAAAPAGRGLAAALAGALLAFVVTRRRRRT